MRYEFLFFLDHKTDPGWWLRLNDIWELSDYLERTDGRFRRHLKETAWRNGICVSVYGITDQLLRMKAEPVLTQTFAYPYAQYQNMYKILRDGGHIYLNRRGGFLPATDFPETPDGFLVKTECDFPVLTENDLLIQKLSYGYRAWLGETAIRNGHTYAFRYETDAYVTAMQWLRYA